MKKSEVLEKYREDLIEVIQCSYDEVLTHHGNYRVAVYIWEDGEIETEQYVGNGMWLKSNSDRELYHVLDIKEDGFNVFELDPCHWFAQLEDWDRELCEQIRQEFIETLDEEDAEHFCKNCKAYDDDLWMFIIENYPELIDDYEEEVITGIVLGEDYDEWLDEVVEKAEQDEFEDEQREYW